MGHESDQNKTQYYLKKNKINQYSLQNDLYIKKCEGCDCIIIHLHLCNPEISCGTTDRH